MTADQQKTPIIWSFSMTNCIFSNTAPIWLCLTGLLRNEKRIVNSDGRISHGDEPGTSSAGMGARWTCWARRVRGSGRACVRALGAWACPCTRVVCVCVCWRAVRGDRIVWCCSARDTGAHVCVAGAARACRTWSRSRASRGVGACPVRWLGDINPRDDRCNGGHCRVRARGKEKAYVRRKSLCVHHCF